MVQATIAGQLEHCDQIPSHLRAFESEYRRTGPCSSSFLDWEGFVWTVTPTIEQTQSVTIVCPGDTACRPSHNAGRRPKF